MNNHEALSYLESAFGTDNEIPDDEALSLKACIEPPDDSSCWNEGYSGDEENADLRRLSRHQLLDPVTVQIVNPSGPIIIGENKTCKTIPTNNFSISSTESTSSKRRKKDTEYSYRWRKKNLEEDKTERKWKGNCIVLDPKKSPYTLFECFFNNEVYELICRESVRYAPSNDRHSFRLLLDEAKDFFAILLLSGYVPLPRRRMYWENGEDTSNLLVRELMPRNRFYSII